MKLKRIPKTVFIWLAAALLYIGFFLWHNGLGIPLSETEVNDYIKQIKAIHPDIEPEELEVFRAFCEADDGDDVVMFNAMKMYDTPRPVPNVPENETSMEVLNRYNRFVMPYLFKRGGHPILVGKAVMDAPEVWGIENARKWTMGGMIRYRSRRDMVEMIINPEFQKVHQYKIAAMEKTVAFPVRPFVAVGGLDMVAALFLFALASFTHLVICICRQKKN
ncbi:MAG: hypothetical protein JRF04_05465 [Deltaproteobacteria bacterium]|nr:hypothetical protein [Deltaproteobacteria bacterium]